MTVGSDADSAVQKHPWEAEPQRPLLAGATVSSQTPENFSQRGVTMIDLLKGFFLFIVASSFLSSSAFAAKGIARVIQTGS